MSDNRNSFWLCLVVVGQLALLGFLLLTFVVFQFHSTGVESSRALALSQFFRIRIGAIQPFLYKRVNQTDCEIHRQSLKYMPTCGLDIYLEETFIKQLLIVSVQRSGTHYIWEGLQQLGIDVHHEGVGSDGAVSWLYAVNSHRNSTPGVEDFGHGYVINNPEPLHKNRFRRIFHQVRHPLRVVSTLLRRCEDWDPIWEWIHSLRGFEEIRPALTPLHRAMLLYWLWNRHIEQYADLRYQSEITTAEEVCRWAGFGDRCRSYPTTTSTHRHRSSGGVESASAQIREGLSALRHPERLAVTWADLDAENATLSLQLKHMCLGYGYSLDPARTPQRPETRRFTA